MKVRLDHSNIRFRVSHQEFTSLLDGKPLLEELALPLGRVLRFRVNPMASETDLALEGEGTDVTLLVANDQLQNFSKRLPTNEALSRKLDCGLKISFEVDVRKR